MNPRDDWASFVILALLVVGALYGLFLLLRAIHDGIT